MAIKSESLRREETKSDYRTEKAKESAEIERLTEEFLAAGGEIQRIEFGHAAFKYAAHMESSGRTTWKTKSVDAWNLKQWKK